MFKIPRKLIFPLQIMSVVDIFLVRDDSRAERQKWTQAPTPKTKFVFKTISHYGNVGWESELVPHHFRY